MKVTSSPHVRRLLSKPRVMWEAFGALLPAAIFGIWYFGPIDTLPQVVAAIAGAVAAQAIVERFRHRPITVMDGAPWVTGLILGMSLPPALSPLIALAGGAVATGVIKEFVTTSTGRTLLNPAMAARVLIVSEFLVPMTTFPVDGVSGATPLASTVRPGYFDMFFGTRGGSIGETTAVLLLLGGAYLMWRGIIRWHLPAAYLVGVAVTSLILGRDPLFDLLAGATIMTAFFIVTDPTTSPATVPGRFGFGFATAGIATFIRITTLFPTGEALGVVLGNIATPFIDRVVTNRVYGTGKRRERKPA
ncbi:Electron transport complex protein RnfD [hydrothermal vent metagenome]|uniref:Electron transport complex protein RnfD n=1 Tax=hydrothermal vent metagenome TaxID=652676 RepID=A0A3B0ST80_9ZZZZ